MAMTADLSAVPLPANSTARFPGTDWPLTASPTSCASADALMRDTERYGALSGDFRG